MSAGPIKLAVVGDSYPYSCRILAIIWEGSATAGDRAVVTDISTGNVVWPGRAADTNNYTGANFGLEGISCPKGFALSLLNSGIVYVYLRES
jgi:hypothetical protein